MDQDIGKRAAGVQAADFIQDDMIVGIGTGSTAYYFIEALAGRCKEGLKITAVASSDHSKALAQKMHIPLVKTDDISLLDITVDGADEIDREKRMIKGGGGALLREKIVASSSREMVVIVDRSKVCEKLGAAKLPVEIVPYLSSATIYKINAHGYKGELRDFKTDGGHIIYDIHFENLIEDPVKVHDELIKIPGVVETGLFFDIAGRVVIGDKTGETEIWQ